MFSYNAMSTVLFGGVVDRIGKNFEFLRDNLPKADIKIPFRTYLSVVFLNTIVVYMVSLVLFTVLSTILEVKLAHRIILMGYLPLVFAVLAFGFLVIYPHQRVSSRRKNIDVNLPFALTHMAAIAESGVPPYMIFKLLSNFDEYGEIAREMKVLVRNIDTYGVDPLTAVREMAERTPSNQLRQTFLGIISATESGGDVKTYIKNAGEQAMFDWRLKRDKFMQQLSAYAEFYTGILIAAPLFLISLFAVMNMIQPNIGGFDILTLTKLSIYILVPFLNAGFLLFLRGVEVEM